MARQRRVNSGVSAAAAAVRVCVILAACMTAACAPLGPLERPLDFEFSPASLPAASGPLAEHSDRVETELAAGESAYWLLDHNAESLRIRVALTDLAADTLDIQYFIWQDDMTGRLLMRHVLDAADRGVRVRFLLDDLAVAGRDSELARLNAHPQVEVRLFNAWRARGAIGRALEFTVRMGRLNHRMHNKVLIADGRFAILGGRNIGDRYFGVYDRFVQNDIDLMVAGTLLDDVRASFERYWRSPLSQLPFDGGVADEPEAAAAAVASMRALVESVADENEAMLAAFGPPAAGWEAYLERLGEARSSGRGELYLDEPAIDSQRPDQLYERFKAFVSEAASDVVISSPYLVPDQEFVSLLERLVERGVRVRILTNSLASNSHVIAHSAYKKWRRALLTAGAELYEMRPDAQVLESYSTPPAEPGSLALHTKAVVVDRRFSFVGSPNVDPRSMLLNTEIGVVADEPRLAGKLMELLERDMEPENAWRVTLEPGGWLKWWNGDESLSRQPAKGFHQRFVEFFMNLLPIKNQA